MCRRNCNCNCNWNNWGNWGNWSNSRCGYDSRSSESFREGFSQGFRAGFRSGRNSDYDDSRRYDSRCGCDNRD